MRRRWWLWLAGGVVVVVLVAGLVGLTWLSDLAGPMPEAEAAFSASEVDVVTEPWLTFSPKDPATTGLIIYPGGRVAPEAYAPLARAIADAGHLSIIVPAPFGLAVLAPDAATEVIEAHPEIDRWVIAGHSLGGAMAAQYAAGHPDLIDGLVLWAAYPPDGTDLAGTDLVVASVYGTEDGLATPSEIEASQERLPADATFVEIEGGNHAQFGWYGPQDGDGTASISREAQQEQVLSATLDVLQAVEASS